jgi:hypothetical protein
VIAGIFVVLFNFDDELPKVMGYSGAKIAAGAIILAIWIGAFMMMRRKPHA